MNQLFQILINGGIVLGVFVILLLNSKGVRKSRANLFLSILLGALTFSVFHLRYAGDVISHISLKAYSMGDPSFLVIAPLLWFYIKELTGERVHIGVWTVFHFIPFLLIIFCSLSFRSILSGSPIALFFDHHPRMPYIVFWIIMVIQFTCYQFFIHKKWRAYQSAIRNEVSNTDNVSISWVRFFTVIFLIINACFLFSLFAVIHLNVINWIWKSAGIVLSLSIFALGYKGILQQEIFYSDLAIPSVSAEPVLEKQPKPDQGQMDRLLQFMETEKPYLDPELSLSSLSKKIGVSRNQLSQLINTGTEDNFYDFINRYRVEEVKRLMANPQKQNYNLLGIALEAGFKSKSTFNLIFKRFTGLTPSEYKKNSA